MPSAGIPVILPGRPAALAPSPDGAYAAAEDGVHLIDSLQQEAA